MTDKTELEVTAAERLLVADILDEVSNILDHNGIGQVADLIRDGEYDEHDCVTIAARHRLATRTPDPTPVAWMPIERAPMDEPILAAIKVHNNRTGASWWERHIIVIDSETGAISDMDYHHGWEADDYEGWQHLPPAPGDMLATPAVPADGLVEALVRMNRFVEGFAKSLQMGDFANVEGALAERMCCNGQMCGCQGASVGDYLAHELRTAALAAYRGEA